MTDAPPRRLASVLFALFVLATCGAFFATQRLKRSTPIVTRVYFYQYLGPACDCRKDKVAMRFDLPKPQRVTVSVVNSAGEPVRTFADDVFLDKGRHRFIWNGRGDNGIVVADGSYRLRVGLRAEGRSVTAPRLLRVDTRPPRPKIVSATPSVIAPGTGQQAAARIVFRGPTNPRPQFAVWRTDGPKPVKVASFTGRRGSQSASWNGLVGGRPAPEGAYLFSVTVHDLAGNPGSAPAVLPPFRTEALRHDGVAVTYFSLAGPSAPVRPGALARFTVGPTGRAVRWRLKLYGRGGAIRTGVAHGTVFTVRIPGKADSDVYALIAQSGGRSATWPVVVGDAGGAAPVLVVVPAITWQGQNPVESNGDGWPDSLDSGDSVPLARGFLHGRAPASIRNQIVPALSFLTRIRANYDLTTDVAIASGDKPQIAGHNGVLLLGSARWITPQLNLQLRHFVAAGGTVASFGEDALRRGADLQGGMLRDPTPPRRANIFGERTAQVSTPEAPLVVSQDKLGLFAGTDNYVGSFTRLERSNGLPRRAAVLTAAGRADPTGNTATDFVAYTLGKGLVIRTGSDQWASQLGSSPELEMATRRMWTLLSR